MGMQNGKGLLIYLQTLIIHSGGHTATDKRVVFSMKNKVLSGWWCCFILISIFLFGIFLFRTSFASQSPSWSGSKIGRVDKVLKPWTPVMATKKSISCWGREYIWGKMPFPDQIMTQGKDILSEPVHLQAMINGKEVD